MNRIFLDAKTDAVTFYERRAYVVNPALSMKGRAIRPDLPPSKITSHQTARFYAFNRSAVR